VRSAVNSFVKAFNDLDKTIKSVSSYDATTKQAGLLLGDSALRGIQSQVKGMLTENVTGSKLSNLMQLGIAFQKDGTLAVDSSKLDKAIANNFDDIAGLFASIGTTTDSLVAFSGSTASTLPGSAPLTISALATRGKLTGSTAPTSLNIVAGVEDQLSLTVDGISTSLTIPPANYTATSLAAALQAKINGASELTAAGVSVSVRADVDGKLTIESNRYGSASKVVVGGTASNNLFPASTQTDGTDVAGTIGGAAGTGSGQFLTAASGTTLAGLKLEVTGGSAPADRGTVSYSRGYADQLTKLLEQFTGSDGVINGQTNSLQKTLKGIGDTRDALNTRLAATEKRYLAQFTALDVAIGQMSQTSNYLTQQLASLRTITG
jgi:flagellar hook-associated protein 2